MLTGFHVYGTGTHMNSCVGFQTPPVTRLGQSIIVGKYLVIPGVKNPGQLGKICLHYTFRTNAQGAIIRPNDNALEIIEKKSIFRVPTQKDAGKLIQDEKFKSAMKENGLEHFVVSTGACSIEHGVLIWEIWHIEKKAVSDNLDLHAPDDGLVLLSDIK